MHQSFATHVWFRQQIEGALAWLKYWDVGQCCGYARLLISPKTLNKAEFGVYSFQLVYYVTKQTQPDPQSLIESKNLCLILLDTELAYMFCKI